MRFAAMAGFAALAPTAMVQSAWLDRCPVRALPNMAGPCQPGCFSYVNVEMSKSVCKVDAGEGRTVRISNLVARDIRAWRLIRSRKWSRARSPRSNRSPPWGRGRSGKALCPRQDSNLRHPLWELDLRPPLMPSLADPAAVQDRSCVPPSGLVDVSVGCQRNSSGTGQTSSGSAGRSAHCHQVCRPAHRHRERQILRPSSSRLDSTRPPDFKVWLHSGQAGASSVMRRTLTERPLRPELLAESPSRGSGLVGRPLVVG
ncbi:hypothetical protein SUDANB51_02866 [Streptomyces sp. enrichment culture]